MPPRVARMRPGHYSSLIVIIVAEAADGQTRKPVGPQACLLYERHVGRGGRRKEHTCTATTVVTQKGFPQLIHCGRYVQAELKVSRRKKAKTKNLHAALFHDILPTDFKMGTRKETGNYKRGLNVLNLTTVVRVSLSLSRSWSLHWTLSLVDRAEKEDRRFDSTSTAEESDVRSTWIPPHINCSDIVPQ